MINNIVIITETNFRAFYSDELLNKTFVINLGGKEYVIHTPKNKNEDIGWLSAPEWFNITGDYDFGHKYDSISRRVSIGAIIIEARVDTNNELEIFDSLSSKIDEYLKRFDDWALVIAGQLYIETSLLQDYKKDMFWLENRERIKISPPARIECYLCGRLKLIGCAQVKKIIESMEANWDYPLELEYYKDAILAYREQRFADSVLDSAMASEIHIRKIIVKKHRWVSEDEREIEMCSLNGLHSLYSFSGEKGILLPSAEYQKISHPRNRAIHEGAMPSAEDAKKSLVETRKILLDLLRL